MISPATSGTYPRRDGNRVRPLIGGAAAFGRIAEAAKALERHDAYVEVNGPSASDVAHNFVQRWNGATERDPDEDLPLPTTILGPCGPSPVQIQRMFGTDRSILEQYETAIDAAERTIYIENQAIPIPRLARRLEAALARDVEVLLLVPAIPEEGVYAARLDPARRALFEGLEALGLHPNFRLAGLPIYVHAKLMIVDDAWATIGSCNLHRYSMSGNSEMNASIWDASVACALRETLRRKHGDSIFTLAADRYACR